jgi:malate synthase
MVVQLEAFLRSRRPATIQVRMRGLHLMEGHFLVDGQPISGGLLYVRMLTGTLRSIACPLYDSSSFMCDSSAASHNSYVLHCSDFAVFVATCHRDLAAISAQPTLYLPKMEGRYETEWWAKLFQTYADMLGIDPKVIRSTTMIEVSSKQASKHSHTTLIITSSGKRSHWILRHD